MASARTTLDEATARQRIAAMPEASAWVSANAGTGKTHVLVNRVARLLLAGADPSRILCITYTKAAAAEMETRLFGRLGEWSLQPDSVLRKGLKDLQGERPEEDDLRRARRLFARALETPGGLKIQTIHAFCQSVLKRFPLEARVPADFKLLEEETALDLQTDARRALFREVLAGKNAELNAAHALLVGERDEDQLAELLEKFRNASDELDALFKEHEGASLWDALWRHLGLSPGATRVSIIEEETSDDALDRAGLEAAIHALRNGAKSSQAAADRIEAFLKSPDRAAVFDDFTDVFLKKDGDPRAKVTTKGAEAAEDAMRAEQARLTGVMMKLKAADTAERSRALLTFGHAYLRLYEGLKAHQGALDFNDLITRTRELLAPPGDAWVHYKLDEGIDHILVDEAQDTSPQQWQIIKLLANEMTSGLGAAEDKGRARSLFAVGDVKQSIYRFQGAAPEEFAAMRDFFKARLTEAERLFQPVELDLSFRSSAPVLQLVDEVFREVPLAARDGAGLHHAAHFDEAPGLVELWPVIEPQDEEAEVPWDIPLGSSPGTSPEGQLAARIAETIRGWLDTGEKLKGAGRPILPSDIMILVRRRSAFMEHMIRALKLARIPVAGADRLKIAEHIAVQDLIALGHFALSPSNDLTLAEVLKSPLVGFDDDKLFNVAHGRKGTLWDALRTHAKTDEACRIAADWLTQVLNRADFMPPYEFYAQALGEDGGLKKMLSRLGPDAEDPIDEFLGQALAHERARVPSLQAFLHALVREKGEIKRDLEKGRDEVRVMTVHGAKGLEGNIVFLPDTCTIPRAQSDGGILKSYARGRDGTPEGAPFFLWAPRKADDDAISAVAREGYTFETEYEYRRLFYVAMTRAKERLYICGWTGVTGRQEGSWHALAETALGAIGEDFDAPTGPGLRLVKDGPVREGDKDKGEAAKAAGKIPNWARTRAPEEQAPRRLTPSALEDEPAVFAPTGGAAKAARRGALVHRLLEVLPDLAPATREQAARKFLDAFAEDFDEAEREDLATETLKLMALPELGPLFGPGSRAEAAISGLIDMGGKKERIEGRVDRLAITDDAVWVLDYKTNRPAAKTLDDVAPAYWKQMAGYRALLRQAYPRIAVRCALVWTHAPLLMVLPDDRLDAQWLEIAGKSKS